MRTQIILLAVSVALSGCDAKPPAAKPAPAQSAAEKTAAVPAAPAEFTTVKEQGTGKITRIEDGVYPMYTMTIALDGGKSIDFDSDDSDLDKGGLSMADLHPGQRVTVAYISGEKPFLVDMTVDDKGGERSVLGSDAPKAFDPTWANISGTLSGAEAVTSSDLPGKVTVTERNGRKLSFEVYVNEEMVPANGKTVMAFYYPRHFDRLTKLKPQ